MIQTLLEDGAGGALLLALPGLAWTRAVFPEWRFRGPLAITRAIETAALALLISVSLTILVGFALTFGSDSGFPATWSDPILEAILAALAVVGLAVALARGGFDRIAPSAPPPEPAPGADSPAPLLGELVRIRRDGRRIEHLMRQRDLPERDRQRLRAELGELRAREGELRRAREAEYAG
ncbi:MAG: hypothetical protein ACYDFT_01200 [Thermoplasmata archaeon]